MAKVVLEYSEGKCVITAIVNGSVEVEKSEDVNFATEMFKTFVKTAQMAEFWDGDIEEMNPKRVLSGEELDWETTFLLVERALNIKLYEEQKNYIVTGQVSDAWTNTRQNGKTTAYCLSLILNTKGKTLNIDRPQDFSDMNALNYSIFFFRNMFLDIWTKLRDAGIPVRKITSATGKIKT